MNQMLPTPPGGGQPVGNGGFQPPQQPISQPVNNQTQQVEIVKETIDKEFPPRYTFYTAKSALTVELSRGYDAIIWQLANSLGDGTKRFNWDEKISLKMGIEEIDNIIQVLEAFLYGGVQGFMNTAAFIQPKNQGNLSFYHQSKNGSSNIMISINPKSNLPGISVVRTDNTGNKRKVYFSLLPSTIKTFIRILDRFADIVISQPTKPYGQYKQQQSQNQQIGG